MTREDMLKECVTPNEEVFVMCVTYYQQGRANAFDEVINYLDALFIMNNNPNSKFVETIVLHRDFIDALEQLKENSNEEEWFKNFLIGLSKNSTAKLTLGTESGKNIVLKGKEIERVAEQLKGNSNER